MANNYPTFEECWLRVRLHYRDQGIALRKKTWTNNRRRFDFCCDRAGKRASTATRRKVSTKQCNCLFAGKIRRVDDTWVWEILDGKELHNHEPTAQNEIAAVAAFQRLSEEEAAFFAARDGLARKSITQRVEELSAGNNMTSREIAAQLASTEKVTITNQRVNRFQMPLFQVVGLTAVNTTFNACFCLVSAETTNFYRWVLLQLRQLLQDSNIPDPGVIITDFDAGLKRAAGEVFANTEQQLCVWHMMKNVGLNAKKKWEGPQAPEADEAAAAALATEATVATAATHQQQQQQQQPQRQEDITASNEAAYSHDPDGLVKAWQACVYASTVDIYKKAWKSLKRQFADQPAIIQYLRTTYIPQLHEFADYEIRNYRNYGVRTTSPTEGAHHELKSYLTHRLADLHTLHEKIRNMVDQKIARFTAQCGAERRRRLPTSRIQILQPLTYEVSFFALNHLHQQYVAASEAFEKRQSLPTRCTGAFFRQWGIPCRHNLLQRLQLADRSQILQPADLDPHWRLDQSDPNLIRLRLLTIEADPNIVPRRRRATRHVPMDSDDEAPPSLTDTRRIPSAWERYDAYEASSQVTTTAASTPAPSQAGNSSSCGSRSGRGSRSKSSNTQAQQQQLLVINSLRSTVENLAASVQVLHNNQAQQEQQRLEAERQRQAHEAALFHRRQQQEAALLTQRQQQLQQQFVLPPLPLPRPQLQPSFAGQYGYGLDLLGGPAPDQFGGPAPGQFGP
ncbi:putative MULE transposase domain-containing protein [Colletotrichum sublineola]|uniref:Putative MULE transposase domain-containing protein n=1 Tax=Colletotrichum sublineola TaxID=1173701 RepID=A0A066XQF7_COLSU|nr:putative MULE transposase domain-containing protein [Colletotrichum sublineola]